MTTTHRLPEGKISLLFTDIEDSSRMNNALGDPVYNASMRVPHNERIRAVIATHGGYEVKTIGDSFMIAFTRAADALACAVAIQEQLIGPAITATDKTSKTWTVKVRIGVHTAEKELFPDESGDYHGADVNFAARVESLGVGGQLLVSDAAYSAANWEHSQQWKAWPDRRIKSFDQPETVWELLWDGTSRGEPGARWLPSWFLGERNRYVPRPDVQDDVLRAFATRQSDGSTPRLVTLQGFGGMGKTRLAIACATQVAGRFAHGVFFVPLDTTLRSEDALVAAIGSALGMAGEPISPSNLIIALRDKEILLVLDNYEAIDSDTVRLYLAEMLSQTSRLHLLVTGREAVKLSDVEQLIDLDTGMTEQEAVALFVARAQLKRRSWQPTPGEADVLQKIVTLTERIPLAIELVAAWTDKRTLTEIAEGLEATPLGAMTGEQRRALRVEQVERHRSMTRCLDWSFELLEEPMQEGFVHLGVFADTFTAESVEVVCDVSDAQALLDRLQDASLIRRIEVDSRSRYTMHRFTRAYTAEKLARSAAARAVRQRFVTYYKRLMADNADGEKVRTQNSRTILDAEWRNARAASEIAEVLKDWGSLLLLSDALVSVLYLRGPFSEAELAAGRYLLASRVLGYRWEEECALRRLGNVYASQGRWWQAESCFQQSLTICQDIDAHPPKEGGLNDIEVFYRKRVKGEILNDLGLLYREQGRWSEGEKYLRQSLQISREIGDRRGERNTLYNLGGIYVLQGHLLKAEKRLRRSLQISRETGDHVFEAYSLAELGSVYHQQKHLKKAEEHFRQGLRVCQEVGSRSVQSLMLIQLGSVYGSQGHWQEAEECLQQGLTICRELGIPQQEGQCLILLGNDYNSQERWQEAEECLQQGLTICRKLGDRVNEGAALMALAEQRAVRGDLEEALALGQQGVAILETTEDSAHLDEARKLVAKWKEQGQGGGES